MAEDRVAEKTEKKRMIHTSLVIDRDLWARFKLIATVKGKSALDIVRELIQEYVEKHEERVLPRE